MKGTILIIEDNQDFVRIYGDRLAFADYMVMSAADGNEGLAKAREQQPDLVITDLNMPNKDGFAVIEEMRRDEKLKDTPILVMSVFDAPEQLARTRELGANGYVIKGTETPNAVVAKVEEMIAARKA